VDGLSVGQKDNPKIAVVCAWNSGPATAAFSTQWSEFPDKFLALLSGRLTEIRDF
jgi:hypothetical protein